MSEWIRRLAEKYSEVNENQKAAMAKKLAKASASSEKGKAAVTLPKAPFEIPESIPANERTAFHGAAAGAHKAGKSHFTFQGKKYPVTMKKDTATAIADEVKEEDVEVVMNPKKEKKEKGSDAEMAQESVKPSVYARILEARGTADKDGKHYRKAADQEDWDEKEKNNKGAMDMKKDMAVDTSDPISNYDEKGHNDMEKAGRVGPKAAMRKGDNAAGDKKVIPSATPTKGM